MIVNIPSIQKLLDELRAGNAELFVGGVRVDPNKEPNVAERAALRLQAGIIANRAKQAHVNGQPTIAADLLLQSLQIETMLGDASGIAADLGNLGSVYLDLGELDKAEACLRQSLTANTQAGDSGGMAIDCYRSAHLEIKRKRLPEALATAQRGLDLAPPVKTAKSLRDLIDWLNKRLKK